MNTHRPASGETLRQRLLHWLYSAAVYLATPLILGYFTWRGFTDRRYWRGWKERFGLPGARPPAGGIVLHAVSLGEVNGALPLIAALKAQRPDLPLTVTTTTPSGMARARECLTLEAATQFLPLDLPGAVRRFLNRLRPALLIVMETEIWPNLFRAAERRGIPIVLANARLTARSACGYRRLLPQARRALQRTALVLAQSATDAQRLCRAGAPAERLEVTGNLKCDIELPAGLADEGEDLRRRLGGPRPVWLAASTHPDEESRLLAVHRRLQARFPGLLLILIPRHPERAGRLVATIENGGFRLCRHSRLTGDAAANCDVLLVDALGVLLGYAAAADVVFVGGSLVSTIGGHNLLEPAALGKPVLIGPHHENFAALTALLADAGGAQVVGNIRALEENLAALLADPEQRAEQGNAARDTVHRARGAVQRTIAALAPLLNRTR